MPRRSPAVTRGARRGLFWRGGAAIAVVLLAHPVAASQPAASGAKMAAATSASEGRPSSPMTPPTPPPRPPGPDVARTAVPGTLPFGGGAVLVPTSFAALDGWATDDAHEAFATFLSSCAAIARTPRETGPKSSQALKAGLAAACAAARSASGALRDPGAARAFFEARFRPYRVVPASADAGSDPGFFTGYYEPELEGSLTAGNGYDVPVYGRPADLVVTGQRSANGGSAGRLQDGKLVPYFDRAAIEDGALAGRGLEIVWLRSPVDLFFMQIQGSAVVRLGDGRVLRLNYDGYNGHPYTPVGRILVDRGIVPREEMSMDRIRAYMEADPDAGRALRRENHSFVFFKVLPLKDEAGAMGAQGVPLTPGRSAAVDYRLHTYGSPIFVEADLPLSAAGSADPFRRLVIAQDTGSAIVGPARADLFFGRGAVPGAIAGRIRHHGGFTLLVPLESVAELARQAGPKGAPAAGTAPGKERP